MKIISAQLRMQSCMSPYVFLDGIEYFVTMNNWIRTGNTRSNCYRIQDGGFEVSFLADRTLYGSYGGAEGKPISVGSLLPYMDFPALMCVNRVLCSFSINRPLHFVQSLSMVLSSSTSTSTAGFLAMAKRTGSLWLGRTPTNLKNSVSCYEVPLPSQPSSYI